MLIPAYVANAKSLVKIRDYAESTLEISDISKLIENATLVGDFFTAYKGMLYPYQEHYLRSLGYTLTKIETGNEISYHISWESA